MKRIETTVRRDKLSEVKLALAVIPHRSLTACDITVHDPQSNTVLLYRGRSYVSDMAPRISISVLVDDADASLAVDAIVRTTYTGRDDDGTIIIVPVEEVIHISDTSAVA